ncbi:MAG: peptide deformylase [Clostridia bacterium]|nr:peptide deformylase [Clostridia bacterium]
MAIRNIVKTGDIILTKKCRKVEKFDQRLQQIIEDMKETMIQARGCGLAAPQIGILRRYAVVDLSRDASDIVVLINPEIIKTEGEQQEVEGCLSCPNEFGIVKRPQKVTVKAQDINGEEFTIEGQGLVARAFCHEIDHLDGILFTDKCIRRLSPEELEEA